MDAKIVGDSFTGIRPYFESSKPLDQTAWNYVSVLIEQADHPQALSGARDLVLAMIELTKEDIHSILVMLSPAARDKTMKMFGIYFN